MVLGKLLVGKPSTFRSIRSVLVVNEACQLILICRKPSLYAFESRESVWALNPAYYHRQLEPHICMAHTTPVGGVLEMRDGKLPKGLAPLHY